MPRPITFLSDYGLEDEFVGVVHAVIAHECPTARVIDLSHGVPRQSVLAGALMLARALPYAPPGVHLAVVDPEVGARRRAVALRTALDDRLLVGPDNGLLLPAADRFGWVTEAVEISTSSWRLEPVSATFHGRDLFAPVAARLAAGEALADAGTPLDPEELVRLELPRAAQGPQEGPARRARDGGRRLRQRAARRPPRRPGGGPPRARGGGRQRPQRALPADLRRRPARRAAALRGRHRDARPGGQRRLGGRGARRRRSPATRSTCSRRDRARAAAAAPPRDRLDEPARARARVPPGRRTARS